MGFSIVTCDDLYRLTSESIARIGKHTKEMISESAKFLDELLSKPNRAEATAWLRESRGPSDRTLGELGTTQESLDLVNEVFEAGAVQVLAVEVATYPDGSQNTGKLIIELPDDPNSRERILAWCNQQGERLGLDPGSYFGQRYTLVILD